LVYISSNTDENSLFKYIAA